MLDIVVGCVGIGSKSVLMVPEERGEFVPNLASLKVGDGRGLAGWWSRG